MEGLFGSLASGLRRRELKTTDAGNLTWAALFGQQNSRAGVSVNVDSALKVSTVFACLRVLADGTAQVPLKVYREKADGSKELAKDHPAYRLLSRRPNEWMTSFEFRQVMMFHAVLLGNGCAYIGRIRGVPRELIPLVPGSYTIEQARDYTLTYRLTGPNGLTTVLPREDVFHLRGPSWTGVAGLDALQVAREAVGLAIATEETHAALHANGTQPGGVLSVKGALDDAARARLKESWAQYQGGLANRFKTAVLDMDSTWTPLGMKGVDAEHLDTRRFQIEEICRDLKVFPQMVGYADKTATFASAEAFFLAHVIHTLKDGNKQYIWMPGIALGKPNTIDGDPYVEVPDMPSEGANTYPIAYGDFARAYTLVDRLAMSLQRDNLTQATSGNVRFLFWKRVGGAVTLAEAIRKLKCST